MIQDFFKQNVRRSKVMNLARLCFVCCLSSLVISGCGESPTVKWQSLQEQFWTTHPELKLARWSNSEQWEKALQHYTDVEDYAARALAMAKSYPKDEMAVHPGGQIREQELWWIMAYCPETLSCKEAIEIYSRDYLGSFPVRCTIIDRHESWADRCFQTIAQTSTNRQIRGQATLAQAEYRKNIMHDDAVAENLYKQVIAQFAEIKVSKEGAATLGEIAKADLVNMGNTNLFPEHVVAGQKIPPFEARATDGTTIKFPESYKNKMVLMDFWATWCVPCVKEIPNVVDAYDRFHSQGLEVLSVSLDQENADKILADFVMKHKMPWPQIYDGKWLDTPLARRFGITGTPGMSVTGIPFALLLDGDTGLVIADGKDLRGPKLAVVIEEALSRKRLTSK